MAKTKLEIKQPVQGITIVPIDSIKQNPENPRIIKDDNFKKLVQSIKDFPEMLLLRPIVVNKDRIILGGNMRHKACIEAGLKEVPIISAESLTEAQQREFVIKDNVSGGEWDWEELANDWDSEKLEEWGLDLPDFGTDEVLNKEQKDLSGDLKETFEVIISCNDETHQEQVYNKMIADGFNVRVLTL